ncbi:MAG: pectate lyase [Pirellulales bacterium]
MFLALADRNFAAAGPGNYLQRPAEWYAGPEAAEIGRRVLSHQAPLGGWPKNLDTTAQINTAPVEQLAPTFDNRATTDELRLLARLYNATKDDKYRTAFERGLQYILKAQYPTGGWPQSYPIRPTTYHRHITFNDDAMVRVLEFLREISDPDQMNGDRYDFLTPDERAQAKRAFDRGIECILKCQIHVNGKLTAWCAQHDELDYRPRKGRWHELPSISGAESISIVRLLMSIEKPSPAVIAAVEGAVAWFRTAEIKGYRIVQHPEDKTPGKFREAVADPTAPTLWARMVDIETNQPLVSGMDSVPHLGMQEIGFGRPGYAWFGPWATPLLEKEYPAWNKHVESSSSRDSAEGIRRDTARLTAGTDLRQRIDQTQFGHGNHPGSDRCG